MTSFQKIKILFWGSLVSLVMGACTPAHSPRATARAAVTSIARGVVVGADVCRAGVAVREAADDVPGALALGRACSASLHIAQDAARAGASAVDTWGDGKDAACAIGAGVAALADVARIAGVDSPELADVLKFAAAFGRDCK